MLCVKIKFIQYMIISDGGLCMDNLFNRLYTTMNTIVDLLFLNLLWVIVSFPLFTFFPATAAMFGVVRKRVLQKDTEGIFKTFFKLFKENFKKSFILSILWSILALFLFYDFFLIQPEASIFQLILFIVWAIAFVIFSAASLYIFPVMVHFELSLKQVIKNAFFFSLMNPVVTMLMIISGAMGVFLFYKYPVFVFFITTLLATVIYQLAQGVFNQAINMKK